LSLQAEIVLLFSLLARAALERLVVRPLSIVAPKGAPSI
jgi:hypothetical protein